MTTREWHEFVSRGARTGKFATVGADGVPHITPVWYVFDGEDFLFISGGTTAKVRALRRDPRAAICVAGDAPPFAYVEARGEVSLSEGLDDLVDVATRAGARVRGPGPGRGARR